LQIENIFNAFALRLKKKYNLNARVSGAIFAVELNANASDVRLYVCNNIHKLKLKYI
jgi:hypothetical protein